MPSKRLTEQTIGSLKPNDVGPVDYYDTVERRLVLRVGTRTKTWRCVFRDADKRIKSVKLGYWPELDVKNARIAAADFKTAHRGRIENPLSGPDEQSGSKPEPTYREVAETYLARDVDGNGLRSARQIRRYFDTVILPEFGDRMFISVQKGDVVKLLDKVEDERGKRTADLILAYVRRLFYWHQSRAPNYISPVVRGMQRTKPKLRRRKRRLTDDEIRALWPSCEKLGTFGALIQMLLLTGQRRTKCATMKWEDVSDGVWTIATEPGEKGNGEQLVLPQMALAIIDNQPVVEGNPYIFPASREGRRDGPGDHFGSFSAYGQGKKELDKLMRETIPQLPEWRLHDLRKTARTLMARAGVKLEVAELILGHAREAMVDTYDLHDYEVEKMKALKTLATLLKKILNPPDRNVVPEKQRKPAKRSRVKAKIYSAAYP